jgi:hypothetical protein
MLYFINLITIAMYRNENISQGLNNIIYLVKLYNYYERRSRLPCEQRGDTCNGNVLLHNTPKMKVRSSNPVHGKV